MLEKQFPAETVVVFLLRADIENDVGDGQQLERVVAVGKVVAVEIGRVHEDFLVQLRAVVGGELAELQGRIEPLRLERLMKVDDRIARGRSLKGGLGNRAAGEGIEQR